MHNSAPGTAEGKNAWSYASIPPYTPQGQLFLDLYTSHLRPGLPSDKRTLFPLL